MFYFTYLSPFKFPAANPRAAAAEFPTGATTLLSPEVQLLGKSQFLNDWKDIREAEDGEVASVVLEESGPPAAAAAEVVSDSSVSAVEDRFRC